MDALNQKRAALEAMVQDCMVAGVEVPVTVSDELQELNIALSGVPRQTQSTQKLTQWPVNLSISTLSNVFCKTTPMLIYLPPWHANSTLEASAANNPFEFVYKIAKPQELVVTPETRPPRDHSTMVLKLEPFDTRPVTPDSNALIELQQKRLNSCIDSAVIAATELDTIEGLNFYQMPFVSGGTLQEMISTRAPNDRLEVLTHLVKCAQTLGRLGISHGFYHGNLKPSNILITDDQIVLTDPGYFGPLKCASGFIEQGMVSSTAYYPLLVPDDLLALGIIFFETMTGVHPFASDKMLIAIDEQPGQSLLDSELIDEINFKRSTLEPYLTPLLQLKRPLLLAPWLTTTQEALILKGLRLCLGDDGLLHKDKGFADYAEFASSLWTLTSQELAEPGHSLNQ
jgi:hypothetical protein